MTEQHSIKRPRANRCLRRPHGFLIAAFSMTGLCPAAFAFADPDPVVAVAAPVDRQHLGLGQVTEGRGGGEGDVPQRDLDRLARAGVARAVRGGVHGHRSRAQRAQP